MNMKLVQPTWWLYPLSQVCFIVSKCLSISNNVKCTACLYGDLGSDDFVDALQQAKYLDVLVDFTKQDWLHLLKK